MAEKELTPKQRRFVEEYLIDLNATQAAIRAGYSEKTANEQGCRLLANVSIKEAIQGRARRVAAKLEITQERVMAELGKLAFSDMRKFTAWGPGGVSLKSSEELEDGEAACVSEVSESTTKDGGSIRFKLHSKPDALKTLAQILGMLKEEVDHTGEIKLTVTYVDTGSDSPGNPD